jgi:recyclin-1
MDRFATLEPVKLYTSGKNQAEPLQKLIGRLPSDLHLQIIADLPLPDVPAYARCSRTTAAFVRNDSVWERRWKSLLVDNDATFKKVLDDLERKASERASISRAAGPPVISVDDDFGDFADANIVAQLPAEEMGDFVGAFSNVNISVASSKLPAKDSYKAKFVRAYNLLRPLTRLLSSPPHVILSNLSAHYTASLFQEAKLLHLLSLFLSPFVKPVRQWGSLYISLRTAMDRYDSNLLAAFDVADGKGDEVGMREAAKSSWEVWDRSVGDWEMGKVWTEKREIFYQHEKWQALDNFT